MIIAQVLGDGQVLVMDRHAKGYGPPPIDSDQNIFNIDWQHVNGKLQLRFMRPLVTTDSAEDVDLTQCVTFLYPFSGGPLG